MTRGLVRFQRSKEFHFVTFSCYHRRQLLAESGSRDVFEQELDKISLRYGFLVIGYVVMPEHVHLLMSEPPDRPLATALQALKQQTSRQLKRGADQRFWQRRYYDFDVWSETKQVEQLRYMHRNPVARGLAESPGEWKWSSFRHHASGAAGAVTIESRWTARERELAGACLSAVPPLPTNHVVKDGAPSIVVVRSKC